MQVNDDRDTPRKFKATITWTDSEVDLTRPKTLQQEAEVFQEEVNSAFDAIFNIESIENLEEL